MPNFVAIVRWTKDWAAVSFESIHHLHLEVSPSTVAALSRSNPVWEDAICDGFEDVSCTVSPLGFGLLGIRGIKRLPLRCVGGGGERRAERCVRLSQQAAL
eukprot:1413550-Pleurochrysis_carterae.AAC.1